MYRPARFNGLELWQRHGVEVPIATTFRSRLIGLAWLDRERAGAGLLLPGCRSIHTFGMRFELDLLFLDSGGEPICMVRRLPPGRIIGRRRAEAVLEIVPGQRPVVR